MTPLFKSPRTLFAKFALGFVLGMILGLLEIAFCRAQTYDFTGLSAKDVHVIGSGLDKLPREDTDRDQLYQRLQEQITRQDQARAKAQADASRSALDKYLAGQADLQLEEQRP